MCIKEILFARRNRVRLYVYTTLAVLLLGFVGMLLPVAIQMSLAWGEGYEMRSGFYFKRLDDESIRISWGRLESGAKISTANFFRSEEICLGLLRDADERLALTGSEEEIALAPADGVWMYELELEFPSLFPAVSTNFVNPKLNDAIDRMSVMIDLVHGSAANNDKATRMAAKSYVFLGYVVMNQEDALALKQALTQRAKVNLKEDIVTPGKTFYRLQWGVEQHFVVDPNDEAALADARRRIPICVPSMARI